MKHLFYLLLLFPFIAFAQTDTLYHKTGEKESVYIIGDDDTFVYYKVGDKKKTISKAKLSSFKRLNALEDNKLPRNEHGEIVFSEVVQAPGVSQDELYSRAREWFSTAFGSAEAVLDMDNREVGKLVGKSYQNIEYKRAYSNGPTTIRQQMWFTLVVEVKEGRYRYEFKDIYLRFQPTPSDLYPIEFTINNSKVLDGPTEKQYKKDGTLTTAGKNAKESAAYLANAINQEVFNTSIMLKSAISKKGTAKDW